MTENVGKLLGFYYLEKVGTDTYVKMSPNLELLINEPNYTNYFRNICFRLQIPNGLKKPYRALEDFSLGYKIKPVHYTLKLLLEARNTNLKISMRDIYNYVLSNSMVARGEVHPKEIIDFIKNDSKRSERTSKRLLAWEFIENKTENIIMIQNIICFYRN